MKSLSRPWAQQVDGGPRGKSDIGERRLCMGLRGDIMLLGFTQESVWVSWSTRSRRQRHHDFYQDAAALAFDDLGRPVLCSGHQWWYAGEKWVHTSLRSWFMEKRKFELRTFYSETRWIKEEKTLVSVFHWLQISSEHLGLNPNSLSSWCDLSCFYE